MSTNEAILKRQRKADIRIKNISGFVRFSKTVGVLKAVKNEVIGMPRSLQRQLCREEAWQRWCVTAESAPKDDRGVIPRRTRRSISLAIARQAFKKMRATA